MKCITLIFSFLLAFTFSAQKTLDVKLILKYKNSPLCNWDVTIKHGDVAIAKSKSNEKGEVVFKNATILSLSIDAYGYKAFNGGDKKWDVKGYIQLNDQGFAEFDFEPLVKDAGMPVSMLESAWGLTINDCGGIVASTPKSEEKSSTSFSNSTTKAEEVKPAEEEEKYTVKDMQQDMKQSMDNMKLMHENKISNLTSKIEKKTKQRDALDSKSKEYSTISYEIHDLELEKEITKVKLEKVNLQISKGYKPLNKSEKEPLDAREDAFTLEQKMFKKKEKDGLFYNTNENIENPKPTNPKTTETKPTETPKSEVKTTEKEQIKSEVKTEKTETKPATTETKTESKPANSEKEEIKIYTENELVAMSVVNLKKIKLEYNTLIAKWKVTLKTKSSFLKPAEIEKYKADIVKVEAQIKLIDAELTKRSAAKG
jgi:hypothetical protein